MKVSYENFKIPQINEYNQILLFNYNVSQLRNICRYHKQKVSGNKNQLIALLYNYLLYSYNAIIIQKIYRGWLQRYINNLRGPAIFNRDCVNETDFYTLEKLKEIPKKQFFSWKDNDNFVYGCDICSLYNYIEIEKEIKNPYNRNKLSVDIINNIKQIIRLSKIYRKNINIVLDNSLDKLSQKQKLTLRATSLFQIMDNFGHITNANWFLNLNRFKLQRYLRELIDIWEYRSQISNTVKKNINPQYGNPFFNFNTNILYHKCFEVLQKRILDIMEIFITKGKDTESKALGIYYILGGLTIVSADAAEALPWLYESFMPHQIN